MSRTRNFCTTIFDYDEKIIFFEDFIKSYCKYGCYGKELTKEGKPHLQCYFNLLNPKSLGGMIKFFAKTILAGMHIEICKGTELQNGFYCKKEGRDFVEIGERPTQGTRTDLSDTRKLLKKTGKMRDIVEFTENYQAIKTSEKYLTYKEPGRDFKPMVYWVYGSTGVGKSRIARRFSDPDDTWVSNGNLKWWDGYDGHKYVILDDFRGSHCSFDYLLRVLDRYQMRVECKGGSRQLRATHMFITSDRRPEECYSVEDGRLDQLLRRVDNIVNLKSAQKLSAQKSGVILSPDLLWEIENIPENFLRPPKTVVTMEFV